MARKIVVRKIVVRNEVQIAHRNHGRLIKEQERAAAAEQARRAEADRVAAQKRAETGGR